MQEGLRQTCDLGGHCRREEQGLAGEGHEFANAFNIGNEAHIEHAVSFINHQNINAGEQKLASFNKIEQAAGRCDQHIRAAHDFGFLIAKGHAANQQSHIELVIDAIFFKIFFDLRGQFAGWLQNERARHAGPCAACFEARKHGQGKGSRLARAGLRNAQNIAPLQSMGDGLGLNGRGVCIAGGCDGLQDFFTESKFFECHYKMCSSATGKSSSQVARPYGIEYAS